MAVWKSLVCMLMMAATPVYTGHGLASNHVIDIGTLAHGSDSISGWLNLKGSVGVRQIMRKEVNRVAIVPVTALERDGIYETSVQADLPAAAAPTRTATLSITLLVPARAVHPKLKANYQIGSAELSSSEWALTPGAQHVVTMHNLTRHPLWSASITLTFVDSMVPSFGITTITLDSSAASSPVVPLPEQHFREKRDLSIPTTRMSNSAPKPSKLPFPSIASTAATEATYPCAKGSDYHVILLADSQQPLNQSTALLASFGSLLRRLERTASSVR